MSETRPSPLSVATRDTVIEILSGPPDPASLDRALRHLAKWRAALLARTLLKADGRTVAAGPFAGMTYTDRASEGGFVPRLLGAYEASLHPVIEEIVARGYARVLDIGCAEGYYAVGLARRMPASVVLAHDSDARARALCADLARANGVADRVHPGGALTPAGIEAVAGPGTLVICDIEGAEEDLLDPAQTPALRRSDILVEAHDCFRPGLSDRLSARFAASHDVQRIDRALTAAPLPAWMERLSDLDRLLALWEWRAGPTPWLWMRAKAG